MGPGSALEYAPPAINLDRVGRPRNESHFGHTNFSLEAFIVRTEYAREALGNEGPPGLPAPPPYTTPGPPPGYSEYPRNGEVTVDRNTGHELGEPHYQSENPRAWGSRREADRAAALQVEGEAGPPPPAYPGRPAGTAER